MLDLVGVLNFELLSRPNDALFESKRLVLDEVAADLEKLTSLSRYLRLFDEVGLRKVRVDDFGRFGEVLLESLFRPCDGVLDLVREVLDRAGRVRLLRRILRRRVGFGNMGKDDLDVGFGTESSGFEKRLLVVDATLIHVLTYERVVSARLRGDRSRQRKLTSSDIVESIRNTVETIEE